MQLSLIRTILFYVFAAALIFLLIGFIAAPLVKASTPESSNTVLFHCMPSLDFWNNSDDDWDDDWDNDWDDDWEENRTDADIRYNRVEGLHMGMKLKRDYLKLEYPDQSYLFGSWGYSFGAKEFQYQIGLEKGFMDEFRMAFGGEYHRVIDTPDRWIIGDLENSLAALLLREDFRDYYLKEGGSGYFEQYLTRNVCIQIGYHHDRLDSVKKNSNWALFGGKKKFRSNPPMNAGDLESIQASFCYDTRNSKKHPKRGWYIQINGERALPDAGSDFNFDYILADLRRYQPLGYGEGVDFRIRAGSGTRDLPWHRSFHLGGVSTLRGFRYKIFPNGPMEIGGNRMLLGQVEFRVGSDPVSNVFNLDVFDLNQYILFADAGWVGQTDPDRDLLEGFGGLGWSDFKSDVGLALTNHDGNVRFEIARRTDTGKKPFNFLIRINRDF
ncbi:BamA/TamA family outer membrane protein [bacterium]|nr:BamA/TamA family outer membrane protein [bacterium]